MNIWISHAFFVLIALGKMHYVITYDDAGGLVFRNWVFTYILYQIEQMISVICPKISLAMHFTIIIGILLSPDWTLF